jgi:hypothetical protein
MSIKLKPSTKQYIKDSRGKMTNKWTMLHFPPSSFKTKELKEMYSSNVYSRKKHLIKKELENRGQEV